MMVIASALYFSKEISENNRKIFKQYYEVYLKASIDLVSKNDPKEYMRWQKKIDNKI